MGFAAGLLGFLPNFGAVSTTPRLGRAAVVDVQNAKKKKKRPRNYKMHLHEMSRSLYNARFMEVVVQKPFKFPVPFDYEEREVMPNEIVYMRYNDYNHTYGPQRFVKRLTLEMKRQIQADEQESERREMEAIARVRAMGQALRQANIVILREVKDNNIQLAPGEKVFPADVVKAAEDATGLVLDANLLQMPTMKTVGAFEVTYKGHPQVVVTFKINVQPKAD